MSFLHHNFLIVVPYAGTLAGLSLHPSLGPSLDGVLPPRWLRGKSWAFWAQPLALSGQFLLLADSTCSRQPSLRRSPWVPPTPCTSACTVSLSKSEHVISLAAQHPGLVSISNRADIVICCEKHAFFSVDSKLRRGCYLLTPPPFKSKPPFISI